MTFGFEVCHPDRASDIESVWPALEAAMTDGLSGVDPIAAYAAKVARDTGESEADDDLADAWERAENAAYAAAFADWHRQPETLTIYAR